MYTDVVVLGTGLVQSIVAAALSKAGFEVIHIDANQYYGGDDASLTIDELVQWAQQRDSSTQHDHKPYLLAQQGRFSSVSFTLPLPLNSRQYSISLAPTITPSVGPFIHSLIASGVARYGGFKLLERVAIFDGPGSVQMVPSSKEDIFRSKQLSLLEKRRLMRFLLFAGGEFEGKPELQDREQTSFLTFLRDVFSLDDESTRAITYALAFCNSTSDQTLPALHRLRRYLRSAGRYGSSPFLVGHYGGLGELAQGFCRTSAVGGGGYILGRGVGTITQLGRAARPDDTDSSPKSPETPESLWDLQLEDFDQDIKCGVIIASPDYIPSDLQPGSYISAPATTGSTRCAFARCVAIINRPIQFHSPSSSSGLPANEDNIEETRPPEVTTDIVDTALLVFPPSSVEGGSTTTSVTMLITGEASMSTPKDRWILHFSMPVLGDNNTKSASELLQPYLHSALTLVVPPVQGLAESEGNVQSLQFTMFYLQNPTQPPNNSREDEGDSIIVADSYSSFFPEVSDQVATDAESCFWRAVEKLKSVGRRPKRKSQSDDDPGEIDGFWPPLDDLGNDDD